MTKSYDDSLELIYLFPLVDGIDINKYFERKDKIPIIKLEWSEPQIKNYADFLLKIMKIEQKNSCSVLPDFYTLVNYKENQKYITQIKTPGQLNTFMRLLILKMKFSIKILIC